MTFFSSTNVVASGCKTTRKPRRRYNTIPLRERPFEIFTQPGSIAVDLAHLPALRIHVRLCRYPARSERLENWWFSTIERPDCRRHLSPADSSPISQQLTPFTGRSRQHKRGNQAQSNALSSNHSRQSQC